MRVVIQRTTKARVDVRGKIAGEIGAGLLIFAAIARGDTERAADYLARRILGLRVFEDAEGKMGSDICETGGSLLVVSNFTLYGDCRSGRRPDFQKAAPRAEAEVLFSYFLDKLRESGVPVETGVWGANMQVSLVNDGPVTLVIDFPPASDEQLTSA